MSMAPDRAQWATFGVDLEEQMRRESVEVPRLLEKCCAAVEKSGLNSTGIYRLSGSTSKVTKLRALLDQSKSRISALLILFWLLTISPRAQMSRR